MLMPPLGCLVMAPLSRRDLPNYVWDINSPSYSKYGRYIGDVSWVGAKCSILHIRWILKYYARDINSHFCSKWCKYIGDVSWFGANCWILHICKILPNYAREINCPTNSDKCKYIGDVSWVGAKSSILLIRIFCQLMLETSICQIIQNYVNISVTSHG